MGKMTQKSQSSTRTSTRPRGVHLSKAARLVAQDTFIESYKLNANKTLACMQANIDYNTMRYWEEHDQTFSFRLNQADQAANDMLLAAAWQRAVKGVERHKISMGRPVYVEVKDKSGKKVMVPLIEREYSDTVLLRLMSWRIPGFKEGAAVNVNLTTPKEYINWPEDGVDP